MPDSGKIAIVAALEREVRPLVRKWPVDRREYDGRRFTLFEKDGVVVICAGIGAGVARRATEAVISLHRPRVVLSAGFAGALDRGLKVGQIVIPRVIVDAQDGSRVEIGLGNGVLVSAMAIADAEQKSKLASAYAAQAVDMEAAAVVKQAEARGVNCLAVKVISDEMDFEMLPLDRFVDHDGRFRTASFVAYFIARPWLWFRVFRLFGNSRKASEALCIRLDQFIREYDEANDETTQEFERLR